MFEHRLIERYYVCITFPFFLFLYLTLAEAFEEAFEQVVRTRETEQTVAALLKVLAGL